LKKGKRSNRREETQIEGEGDIELKAGKKNGCRKPIRMRLPIG